MLAIIKAETRPAFNAADDKLDMNYLLDQCPQLASFYEELLRTANQPIDARVVAAEVTIGGKKLLPGRKLLMPYEQLHTNPQVFGANANEFGPTRFLKRPDLLRSTSWRPFGGVKTHCPGRFLARREVYMFLALLLFWFEIKLVSKPGSKSKSKPKFPVLDTVIPAGGVLPPVVGDDVFVEVRPLKV